MTGWWEAIGLAIAGRVFGLTGTRGVNHMLKIIKNPLRAKLKEKIIIEVLTSGHFVRIGDADKPVSFHIRFIRPATISLKIISIEYQIIFNNVTIQRKEDKEIKEIKGDTLESYLDLFYYPIEAPTRIPISPDGWAIKGVVMIDCLYGQFAKEFTSTRTLTVNSDVPWGELRRQMG